MRRAAAEPAFETSPASFANASPAFFRDSFSAAARSARSPATASRAADSRRTTTTSAGTAATHRGQLIADGILGADGLPCTALMSAADADRPRGRVGRSGLALQPGHLAAGDARTSMYCVTTAIETTCCRIAWIRGVHALGCARHRCRRAARKGVGDARFPGCARRHWLRPATG